MKLKIHQHFGALILGCTLSLGLPIQNSHAQGGIVTDGTMGAAQNLTGTHVTIPQSLGTTVGHNLFHSFGQFNVQIGQTVTFTENTTNSLNNVISRVTGGSSSDINGLIRSTPGGHANFYLINPAGVVFGKDAQIDVPGAFHVSTASELKFADGNSFSASNPNGSSLSSVEPSGFGFLASSTGNNGLLQVQGAKLAVNAGQTLDLVAGKIQTSDNASLFASNGEIRLVAIQGAGNTSLGQSNGILKLPVETPSATNAGSIDLWDSNIKTAGNGGGRVGIWGGRTTISTQDPSKEFGIFTLNTGSKNASTQEGVEIISNQLLIVGTSIQSDVQSSGQGGGIRLQSYQDTEIQNGGKIASLVAPDTQGNGGYIDVKAGRDLIVEGKSVQTGSRSGIISDAQDRSTGNAGTLTINTGRDISIGHVGIVGGGTYNKIKGDNGNVSIHANGDINVDTDGEIISNIGTTAKTGEIYVSADGNITVDGSITSKTRGGKANAAIGDLRLTAAGDININTNGTISSMGSSDRTGSFISIRSNNDLNIRGVVKSTQQYDKYLTYGNSGGIQLHAGKNISIIGNKSRDFDNVTTSLDLLSMEGYSGNIKITTDAGGNLSLTEGGVVSSETGRFGHSGHGGDISLDIKGKILIDGESSGILSGTYGNTDAGNIYVDSESAILSNHAIISSTTYGAGLAGRIHLSSPWGLSLLNGAKIQSNSDYIINKFIIDNVTVSENIRLASGNAGTVDIDGLQIILRNSEISSNTTGIGNAGKIIINTVKLLIANDKTNAQSGIFSKADFSETNPLFGVNKLGNAGSIDITAYGEIKLVNSGSGINTLSTGDGTAGNILIHANSVTLSDSAKILSSSKGINSSGKAGKINITATEEINMNKSEIAISNEAVQSNEVPNKIIPSSINITAKDINITQSKITSEASGNLSAGNIGINYTHRMNDTSSSIETTATSGNGGSIIIKGGELLSLLNSNLTTTAKTGQGNGGNLNVKTDVLFMENGKIQANAVSGNGGNVNLNLKGLIATNEILIQDNTRNPLGDISLPNYNLIQSVSKNGVSGRTKTNAPQLNLSGTLSNLGNPQFDSSILSPDYCNLGAGSTLTRQVHGGLLPKGDDLLF